MSVKFNFEGKVALITGSSSGIGAATAILFAKSGAQVIVTGLEPELVEEVTEKCQKISPKLITSLGVVGDLTKENDAKRLLFDSIEKFGKIDILINNVGIPQMSEIIDENYLQVFRENMNTNLTSTVMMTHLCANYLSKTNGKIINISSVASLIPEHKLSIYSMSKSAIDIFTKCMALELGQFGVRVNSVRKMGFSKYESEGFYDLIGSKYPVGRVGNPEDIARSILFLASDSSEFITGTNLIVDGGHVAAGVGNSDVSGVFKNK